MILAHIEDSERYYSLHPLFKQLFDYVKTHDLSQVPAERITLDGERLFINVADASLKSPEEQVLEVHRRYIDVHFPLSSNEVMGWSPLQGLQTESVNPFNDEDDYAVYAETAQTYLTIRPGEFAIVWPEDAHAPIIGEGKLRKLIAKVLIDSPLD